MCPWQTHINFGKYSIGKLHIIALGSSSITGKSESKNMNTYSVLDTYHQIAFQKGCIQNFHYHQQHSVLVKIM